MPLNPTGFDPAFADEDSARQALQTHLHETEGVARDFNNLLMVIIGLAEGIIERLPAADPLRLEVQQILDAGTRGAALAAQLLHASRSPAAASAPASAHAVAGEETAAPVSAAVSLALPPETILVVDDEAPVRVLLGDALHRLGYRVLIAEDAVNALTLLRENLDEVRLLLTDMVMPRKSGRDLAIEAQQLSPSLAVLFMSGFPDRSLASDPKESSPIARSAFLQKPFALEALAVRVRQMLDEYWR